MSTGIREGAGLDVLASRLAADVRARGMATLDRLPLGAALADELRASWGDLHPDPYLSPDRGLRERRFAAFDLRLPGPSYIRLPDAAHVQEPEHNRLFGGVHRKFAPLSSQLLEGAAWRRVLGLVEETLFLLEGSARFLLELHAMRARTLDGRAEPTPEGMHQDGRDWVFILLLGRSGVSGGRLRVEDAFTGELLAHLDMDSPLSLALFDDRRVRHGATAIIGDGHRDALVVTARRQDRLPER